jgi:hypothetical protein
MQRELQNPNHLLKTSSDILFNVKNYDACKVSLLSVKSSKDIDLRTTTVVCIELEADLTDYGKVG